MNNIAYNKAKEHLKDFTKFPSINDIVLLMEEYAKDTVYEFHIWCYSHNLRFAHGYWYKFSKRIDIRTEELYEQFLKEQENE
jgi:hypothetical protein